MALKEKTVEIFGDFVIVEKISSGGMAEVFKARALGSRGVSKVVAIKKILPEFLTDNEYVKMFENEARISVNLTHSNIAQIYEFGTHEGHFFLVMEYVDGFNLRSIYNRYQDIKMSFEVDQVLYIVSQAANGLHYAHTCTDKSGHLPLDIVHRDLNHSNIMVTRSGEIKIIDFGIAKTSQNEKTKVGTLKGKFAYMSPEQAKGGEIDARSDIFSLGIVLWELLAGRKLFTSGSDLGLLTKVTECKIESPKKYNPKVDSVLEKFVMKALQKDKKLRYQTAAHLYKDLHGRLNVVNPGFLPVKMATAFTILFSKDKEGSFSSNDIFSEELRSLNEPSVVSQKGVSRINPQNVERTKTIALPKFVAGSPKKMGAPSKINFVLIYKKLVLMAILLIILLSMYSQRTPILEMNLLIQEKSLSLSHFAKEGVQKLTSLFSSGNKVTIRVLIESVPPGAEIEFQSQKWGKTPSTLVIPSHTNVSVRLIYKGYLDYLIERSFDESDGIRAVLQKTPK